MKILGWIALLLVALTAMAQLSGAISCAKNGKAGTAWVCRWGAFEMGLLTGWSLVFPNFNKLHLFWLAPVVFLLTAHLGARALAARVSDRIGIETPGKMRIPMPLFAAAIATALYFLTF